jgi:hypothetical protein
MGDRHGVALLESRPSLIAAKRFRDSPRSAARTARSNSAMSLARNNLPVDRQIEALIGLFACLLPIAVV